MLSRGVGCIATYVSMCRGLQLRVRAWEYGAGACVVLCYMDKEEAAGSTAETASSSKTSSSTQYNAIRPHLQPTQIRTCPGTEQCNLCYARAAPSAPTPMHTDTNTPKHTHAHAHSCITTDAHAHSPTESPTQPCLRRLTTRLPAGFLDPSPRTPGPPHTSATQ